MLLILWVGSPALSSLGEKLPELTPAFEWEMWQAIFLGGFLAFFAFLGFEDMVNVAEEVKTPSKTFPIAILLALIIATVLYLGVSLVSILLLTPEQLAASDAPFATIYTEATGKEATLITYIGIFAIINGALIQMIMASRILYGMSKKGWLPALLSRVNAKTQTPVVAIFAVMLVTIAFALWLPLVTLANLTSSLILIVFTFVNISLIRIKRKEPSPDGVRTIPFWVPLFGTAANLFFLGVQLFA